MIQTIQLQDLIGSGSFGTVYAAQLNNQPMAVKKFNRHPDDHMNYKIYEKEKSVMMFLQSKRHRNILHLKGWNNSNAELYYELLSRKTLQDVIIWEFERTRRHFTAKQIMQVTYELLLAMQHLTSLNLVHGDIKPTNIGFLKENNKTTVKLIDFGCLFHIDTKIDDVFQTAYYRAPEVFGEKGQIRNIQLNVDVFSLGCTVAEMYTGKPLFLNIEQEKKHQIEKHYKEEIQKHYKKT
jgi:serine/threonine protein kinase